MWLIINHIRERPIMNHVNPSLFDTTETILPIPPRIYISDRTEFIIYLHAGEDEAMTQEILRDVRQAAQSGWYDNPVKE